MQPAGIEEKVDTVDEAVFSARRAIEAPDMGRSIVELGRGKNIEIKRRKVRVELQLPTPTFDPPEQIKNQCIDAIKAIEGTSSVEVTLTTSLPSRPLAQRKVLKVVKNLVAVVG